QVAGLARKARDVMYQSIDQRSRLYACTKVNHHAGRLVYNQQIFVFVDDIERQGFRQSAKLIPWSANTDTITRGDRLRGLVDRGRADADKARTYLPLDLA